MVMIHPSQSQQRQQESQCDQVYEIEVSEHLPCFDPSITIANLLLGDETALRLARFWIATKPVFGPVYFVGLVFRIVETLAPVRIGGILAVISAVFQLLPIFIGMTAFRYEYVKVLVHTFEFWFLASTATIWVACSLYYIRDVRAIMLPIAWVEFINLVLIETHFENSKTILLVVFVSVLFVVSLTSQISINVQYGGNEGRNGLSSHSSQVVSLAVKDVLVNTMGTMLTLMVRVIYRKYKIMKIMKNERHGATWTQSIGYRCGVALTNAQAISSSPATGLMHSVTTSRRLPMRFIKIPTLFRADNTVFPRFGSNRDIKRWQICVLYACGGMGYTMSSFAVATSTSKSVLGIAIPVAAITGLSATFIFWCYSVSCCQRQLLFKLCTSFDFVFLVIQLIATYITTCDLLMWNWILCCGISTDFLWMSWVLMFDALTPMMKTRLKLKVWYGVLVLLLYLVKQLTFLSDVLSWHHWAIQNRLLFHQSIGGYDVQFRVFPFLFSRQVTILVWCVRILHRIKTRKTENDLIILRGNVEYDCQPEILRGGVVPVAVGAIER